MGLASSVPANATIYQPPEQSGNNVYTDKGYVDKNFLTNDNFNTFHKDDYRPFKADYENKVKSNLPGSLAYALQGITDDKYKQLQNYVNADSFAGRFDNRFESDPTFNTKFNTKFNAQFDSTFPAKFDDRFVNDPTFNTKFNTKFDNRFESDPTFNTKFNTKFNTQLSAQGYNTLGSGWKINQDTITKAGSAPVTRICYLNGTQREMCVDQNGKVYLQGLGINNTDATGNSDLDVYSSLLAQQTNYWETRPELKYAGGLVYNPIAGIIPTSSSTSTSSTSTSSTITTSSAVITTPSFGWTSGPVLTQTSTSTVNNQVVAYNYNVSGNVTYPFITVNFLGTFQNAPSTINIIYNNASITSSTTIPVANGTLSNITFAITAITTTGFRISFNARYNGTTTSSTQINTIAAPSSSFKFTYSATA
jgi:hypothetical protein